MADYKEMYLKLFRGVSQAVDILQRAQLDAEEVFILSKEPELTIMEKPPGEDGGE